jgi:hypothetical protein
MWKIFEFSNQKAALTEGRSRFLTSGGEAVTRMRVPSKDDVSAVEGEEPSWQRSFIWGTHRRPFSRALVSGPGFPGAHETVSKLFGMPPACPVEVHVRSYQTWRGQIARCHGLVPWSLTLVATKRLSRLRQEDAPGLSRGVSRRRLQQSSLAATQPNDETHDSARRCHGLVPWSLPLAATKKLNRIQRMPRACPVEPHAGGYKQTHDSRKKMPRPCAVESHAGGYPEAAP